jgi:hypothetical protein
MAKSTKIQPDVSRVLQRFDTAEKLVKEASRVALYNEIIQIMRLSIRQVPVDTGLLRSTAYVTLPTTGSKINIKVGYGSQYVVYVHENTTAFHNPPTKAKFLSDPIQERLNGFAERVAANVKRMVKNGQVVSLSPVMPTEPKADGMSRRSRRGGISAGVSIQGSKNRRKR